MLQYIVLPAVGFLIGLVIISLGGGGGAFYVGVLTAFLNVPPVIAASTSLATTIPTTAIGAFSHWRAGNVNLRLGLAMLVAGAAGSLAGSFGADLLSQDLYYKITGAVLILLAVQMLVHYLRRGRRPAAREETRKTAQIGEAVAFGLLGGGMSGLMGLSGGAAIVAGLSILGCGALETVGTSVLVLLGISVTGFLAHLTLGSVDWKLVGLLAAGTMTGAFFGPMLLKRLDPKKTEAVLRPVLVGMTGIMGIILLFK